MTTTRQEQQEIRLPAGPIRYRDSGEGEPIVFVHGYLANSRLWDGVVERLSQSHRCIAPDWPLGSQAVAMNPSADLSPPGIADIIASFLDALDLDGATIVGNDSGGAMSQVFVASHPDKISRLVLTNCDSHENFPPGVFKALPPLAKLPGGVSLLVAPFRVGFLTRAIFRPLARKPIPVELLRSWVEPGLEDLDIRRDLRKVTVGMNKRHTLDAADKLRSVDLPVLLAWAPGDRVFPLKYAERLASGMPNARIVEIPDAGTFVPLDQPRRLAEEIAAFVRD